MPFFIGDGVVAISTSRRRDVAELAIGYGLILAVLWTPNPAQRILYWTAFGWIAVTSYLRRGENRPHGLGWRGLLASLWIVAAAVVIFFLGIAAAARLHTLHPLYGVVPVGLHILGYAVWALMQQFILQVYVLLRLLRLGMRRKPAVATAAVLFCLAHIPNPVLVAATLVWGAIACVLYLRYRNLYAIAVAHGILGMCIGVTIPNRVQRHLRVGLGYLEYHSPAHRSLPTVLTEPGPAERR